MCDGESTQLVQPVSDQQRTSHHLRTICKAMMHLHAVHQVQPHWPLIAPTDNKHHTHQRNTDGTQYIEQNEN